MKILKKVLFLSMTFIAVSNFSTGGLLYADCVAKNNSNVVASQYISKCRKGSIKSVYPAELLGKKLGEIRKGKSATYKRAWKLLNDSRFKK